MKISRYVTIIPLGNGTTLLYGARKDSFVIVHKNLDTEGVALSEILDEDSGTDCIKMTEAGIFIEDDLDEVSELRDRISEVDGDGSVYHLHINPTLDCNLRNIETLAGNGALVIVRVNYTLANISSLMDLCDDLTGLNEIAKSHITVNIQRVWQDCEDGEVDTVGMVHAALKKLSATGIKCNSHLDLEMVNNSCYGDKRRYALINYDGNVFRCTARDFKPEQRSGILHVDGHVEWDEEYVSRRMSVKMSRPQCVECRIAPLCGGGCRQKALETPEDVACLHGYSEEEKVRRVMNRFEACFMNR